MNEPTMPTCGNCYMVVCARDKRIIEQCECTSARKRRIDVPCPNPPSCWRRDAKLPTHMKAHPGRNAPLVPIKYLFCENCGKPGVSWEDGVILCDDCAILQAKKWQMDREDGAP